MEYIAIDKQAFEEMKSDLKEMKEILIKKSSDYLQQDKYYDVNETLKILHVSRRTLQKYRDSGLISFSQISGKIYFSAQDISDHMKRHHIKGYKDNVN